MTSLKTFPIKVSQIIDFNHFNQILFIVDGLVQDLKDALMTKEMQDAVSTIEFVLGNLYTLSNNIPCGRSA